MYTIGADSIPGFSETGFFFQRTSGRLLSGKLHTHTFYEFIFVAAGSCVHEVNDKVETLHVGDFVFLTPQAFHRFISQTENTDVIALSVVPKEIGKLFSFYEISDFSTIHSVLNLPIEKQQTLLSLCENVVFMESEEYIKKARLILNQMFLFCIEPNPKATKLPSSFAAILEKMQALSNAAEGISAFLRLSGYSHSQLCRLTKKYLDATPSECINRIRMNHAYTLIVYSDMDYETICNTVGFESFSYFSKLVKAYYGCSASRLRNGSKDIRKTV